MRTLFGRRTLFFLAVTAACLALVLPTPSEFRWVPWSCVTLGGIWAILLGIEDLVRPGSTRRESRPPFVDHPLQPPPRPRSRR